MTFTGDGGVALEIAQQHVQDLRRKLRNAIQERDESLAREKLALDAVREFWKDGPDDRPLPEDAAIKEIHPSNSGKHYPLYLEALRLVGAKRSKYGLVGVVFYLLHRIQSLQDTHKQFTEVSPGVQVASETGPDLAKGV